MPLIAVELTEREIEALKTTRNPTDETIADAIRRLVLDAVLVEKDDSDSESIAAKSEN